MLGPYEERLRYLLINNENIPKDHYPFVVVKYKLDTRYFPGMMMGFPSLKMGRPIQRFLIWGFMILIYVTTNFKFKGLEHVLFSNGTNYVVERQYVELAGPNSVFQRLFDDDVKKQFSKLIPRVPK